MCSGKIKRARGEFHVGSRFFPYDDAGEVRCMKLLLVEDETGLRAALCRILENEHYDVEAGGQRAGGLGAFADGPL